MDDTCVAWSGARERGNRWSVAPIGGRGLDRPLAPAFFGGMGGCGGRGDVTSAGGPDYRPPKLRRRIISFSRLHHGTLARGRHCNSPELTRLVLPVGDVAEAVLAAQLLLDLVEDVFD